MQIAINVTNYFLLYTIINITNYYLQDLELPANCGIKYLKRI